MTQSEKSEKAIQYLYNGKRWEIFWNIAHVGLIYIDERGYLTEVNPFFCNWLESPKNELLQKHINDITLLSDVGPETSAFDILMSGLNPNNAYTISKTWIARDKSRKCGKVIAVGLYKDDKTQKPYGALALVLPQEGMDESGERPLMAPNKLDEVYDEVHLPISTRVGKFVLSFIREIKDLSMAQCILVAVLSYLVGLFALMYLYGDKILEVWK